MSQPWLTVATWNMQWKRPATAAADLMLERLAERPPQIVCLTEAYRDVLARWGGHTIEAKADYGYPIVEGRRKVVLWSREPWEAVDSVGSAELPSGRYVSGRTRTA